MFSKSWLRIASEWVLLIACLSVVGTSCAAVSGGTSSTTETPISPFLVNLFLTIRTKEEERDSPWWWYPESTCNT